MDENKQQVPVELSPTWNQALHVWWAFLWRNLIAIVVAFFVSFSVCFLLAVILSVFRVPLGIITIIAYPVAALIGLGTSIFPIKMILGKKFKGFRLIIVEDKK